MREERDPIVDIYFPVCELQTRGRSMGLGLNQQRDNCLAFHPEHKEHVYIEMGGRASASIDLVLCALTLISTGTGCVGIERTHRVIPSNSQ